MSKLESTLEEALTDSVETYLTLNKEDMIRDIRELVVEGGKTLPQALETVLVNWLDEDSGYYFIEDEMHEEIERSCEYEYDCEKIIFEYGFTKSLEAAKRQRVRLSDTNESEVALAVLRMCLPERAEIRPEVEAQLTATAEYQKLAEEVQKAAGENAVEVENVAEGGNAAENEGGDA